MMTVRSLMAWGPGWNAGSLEPGNPYAAACAWNAYMHAAQIMALEACGLD